MKRALTLSLAACLLMLAGCRTASQPNTYKPTYSSFDQPSDHPASEAAKHFSYDLQGTSLQRLLRVYEELSGRTALVGSLPDTRFDLHTPKPLTRIEALQMLDTLLAQHQIAMVLSGDKAVKAVPAERAQLEVPPEVQLPWQALPQSSSMMSRTVHLQHFRPLDVVAMLAPSSQLRGGLVAIDAEHTLLLRDYASAIRQQLKLLEELEQRRTAK